MLVSGRSLWRPELSPSHLDVCLPAQPLCATGLPMLFNVPPSMNEPAPL